MNGRVGAFTSTASSTRRVRQFAQAVGVALTLVTVGCGDALQSPAVTVAEEPMSTPTLPLTSTSVIPAVLGDETARIGEFLRILYVNTYDYEPAGSPQELAAMADLVVSGTIVGVDHGRSMVLTPDAPADLQTHHFVFEVVVSQVVKDHVHFSEASLYMEVPRREETAVAEIKPYLPQHRVVLFLDDRTDVQPEGGVIGPFNGRPEGSRVFAPFVQGFVIETEAAPGSQQVLVSAFADFANQGAGWPADMTADELIAAVA